jgi:N-methylhydantoinase A
MKYRVGIDVGGTFTDLVCIDEEGRINLVKSSSTTHDLSIGIVDTIVKAGINMKDVNFLSHGSTVGANTVIENKGAAVAIITTKGFRDVLELRRGQRVIDKPADMYNLQMDLPQDYVGGYDCLVKRPLRYEVSERMDYRGKVVKELDEGEVRRIAHDIKAKGIQAVVICYLHSYANPNHEQRTAEIVHEILPDVYLSVSSEILPIIREYERLSTATVNAYIMPIVQQYLLNLRNKLAALGYTKEYYLMQSSGGIMSAKVAALRPVYTIDSGPAGGVTAAAQLGVMLGYPDVISFDMGGTTAKVCVVRNGRPEVTTNFWAGGKYFIGAPVMNMVEIGAGGGSIVWVDSAGAVHVGPQSAGAEPGPACYQRGGTEPTVTDADLVLGYINPDYFLGGEMHVNLDASKAAIQTKVAARLRMGLAEAAYGIYRLVNANMIGAMRVTTIQRGYDPRDFSLVVSGGTAAIHAVRMAQELRIPRVIVPLTAGVFSALGLITADAMYEMHRSYVARTSMADPEKVQKIYDEIEREAKSKIEELGFKEEQVILKYKIDMRYVGQAHEVTVEVPEEIVKNKIDAEAIGKLTDMFHESHKSLFGHASRDAAVEFITISVSAIGPSEKGKMMEIEQGTRSTDTAFKQKRKVYFEDFDGYIDCPTYERSRLRAGNEIVGPAVVEQMDTTTVIPPQQRALVDIYGNIIIEVTA